MTKINSLVNFVSLTTAENRMGYMKRKQNNNKPQTIKHRNYWQW